MQGIVEAEAADGPDVVARQRGKEHPHVGHLVRHLVPAEDVTGDDARLPGLGDVRHPVRQDRVAIIHTAVLGHEAHETLFLSTRSG